MENKNAFTLIELLAVIIVLSLIALITIPVISDSLITSSTELYEQQVKSLEDIARIWGSMNTDLLSETEPYILTIDVLKRSGLVENKDVLNPNTEETLTGCIKISYRKNQYVYEYTEDDCD